jgi:VanZ family protein
MKPLLRYLPQFFFACLALVTVLALIPAPSVPQAVQFWDKAQHALAFAALAIIGCCAFPQRVRLVFIGLLLHGALIEVLQGTLTTTRFADVFDWFADGVGVLIGVSLFLLALRRFTGRSPYRD